MPSVFAELRNLPLLQKRNMSRIKCNMRFLIVRDTFKSNSSLGAPPWSLERASLNTNRRAFDSNDKELLRQVADSFASNMAMVFPTDGVNSDMIRLDSCHAFFKTLLNEKMTPSDFSKERRQESKLKQNMKRNSKCITPLQSAAGERRRSP